ncbi:hypothetical protein ACNJ7E_39750 [Rhodococcus sp. NM-2]|uniref:hypothetical protein n=1 Tax=Rhodococcus sp. NM-2 TaxID=3401174 RepID=UPI003AABADFC
MTKQAGRSRTPVRLIGARGWTLVAALTTVGALLGALGALAWRFMTPFGPPVNVGIQPSPPPPATDGDDEYYFDVITGFLYNDPPQRFPATAWFLTLGVVVALIYSIVLASAGWGLERRAAGKKSPIATVFSVLGAAFGLVVALIGSLVPPRFRSVVQEEPRDPTNPDPNPVRMADHFHLEFGPTWITSTVVGLAVGLTFAALLLVAGFRTRRDRNASG